MNPVELFGDGYARKARLWPAFLALLPVFVLLISNTTWMAFDFSNALWVAISGALMFFVSDFARGRGKKAEKKFLQSWGGWPSKTMLRHRDQNLDPVTKARYHAHCERLIVGFKTPAPDEENADRAGADHWYETVTKFLLANTRDKGRFPLILEENITYGFRRNLYGLKQLALATIAISIFYLLWLNRIDLLSGSILSNKFITLIVGSIFVTALWVFVVTPAWVREAANDYARQLLMALDNL